MSQVFSLEEDRRLLLEVGCETDDLDEMSVDEIKSAAAYWRNLKGITPAPANG